MSQNWSEEWKRTKSYLIRSIFENIPMLSPIPEANEPVPDILTPADSATRAYSPLPELILEREKNRHDEPEEYYQMLEKQMLRLYKKMFLEEDLIEYESEVSEESDMSIGNDQRSVCGDEATEQHVTSPTSTEKSLILVSTNKLDILSKQMGEQPELTYSVGLVDTQAKTDRNLQKAVEDEIEEEQIEIMRSGAANIRSIGSIAGEQTENSKKSLTPASLVERDMSLIQSVETSPLTDSRLDSSEDSCGLIEFSIDSNCSRKRSGSLNIESKIKRKRYETRAVQTSSISEVNSSEETIWDEVRDNFFCGTPLMFNLCRCRDHKCV